MNKISVNIYDKEYTVMGDQSPEQIAKMSAYVDRVMREIGQATPDSPMSSVAVLSAMTIVDELFKANDRNEEMQRLNQQYEADTQHYVQLWEEAKKNFVDYKQDSQKELDKLKDEKEALRTQLQNKIREVESVMRNQENIEARVMEGSQEAIKEAQSQAEQKYKELENKYNELENNYFDLQMVNIQLKSEIEKTKSNLGWTTDGQQGY